jgi:hypothetical protein
MNIFVYFVSCNVTEGLQNELFCSFCLLKSDRGGTKWTFLFILSLVMWQRGAKWIILFILLILSLVKWQIGYEMNHFVHFVHFVSCKVTEVVQNESFCLFCPLLIDRGGTKWIIMFILFILSLEKWHRGYKMNLFVYFVSCNVTEGVQNELFCSFWSFCLL